MPNVYKPGLIQIKPQYSQEARSEIPENVTWWTYTGTGPLSAAELASLSAIFDPAWGNMWKNIAPATATYTGAIYTDWSSAAGLELNTVGTAAPIAGAVSGSLGPAQVAVLLNAFVPVRYRGGHPRIYLPHICDAILANDHSIVPGNQTLVTNGAATLQANMATGFGSRFFFPCIYRFRRDPVKATVQTIGPWQCVAELATQRRRLRKTAHR